MDKNVEITTLDIGMISTNLDLLIIEQKPLQTAVPALKFEVAKESENNETQFQLDQNINDISRVETSVAESPNNIAIKHNATRVSSNFGPEKAPPRFTVFSQQKMIQSALKR